MVTPDETGWKVAGRLHWLWVAATPETTVYAIQPGRGYAEAVALLGADYAGVLVRDGWAPYRRFTQAAHQTCRLITCAAGARGRATTPTATSSPKSAPSFARRSGCAIAPSPEVSPTTALRWPADTSGRD